jgi:hypothetical protein
LRAANKWASILLLTLAFSLQTFIPEIAKPCKAQSMDLTVPVGIYNVSTFTPKTLNVGEPLNITVIVNIAGLNRESPWYNLTMVEGVESVTASIVEAGIKLEAYPNQIMLTNLNATLYPPTANYVYNKTSITVNLACNSSTLKVGTYSIHVLVKGFRYAYTGFSFDYFNFYIEKGASMSMTLQVISESVFQNPLTWISIIALTALTLTLASKKLRKTLHPQKFTQQTFKR